MTPECLAAIGSLTQGIGTILGSVAVFGAAWIARSTFKDWHTQQVSSLQLKAAIDIGTAAYNAQRGIAWLRRSPSVDERILAREYFEKRHEFDDVDFSRKRVLVDTYVLIGRFDETKQQRNDLEKCIPYAKSLFNDELAMALNGLLWKYTAIMNLAKAAKYAMAETYAESQIASILSMTDEDAISIEVADLVRSVDSHVMKILRTPVKNQG